MTHARKKKIPQFYMIFDPKNARILHKNFTKNFFPEFRGKRPPHPHAVPPVFYAYEFVEVFFPQGGFVVGLHPIL